MAHKVITALVITKNEDGSDLYLYQGAVVPARIKGAELARLVEGGFVADLNPEPEPSTGERPNESGPGSAKEKWLAYAAAHEVEVDAAAPKEDLIAVIATAGF